MDPIHCAYCFGEGRCYPDCDEVRERLHAISLPSSLDVVMGTWNSPRLRYWREAS